MATMKRVRLKAVKTVSFRQSEMTNYKNNIVKVLRSERLRLTAGTWSPWMLKEYARLVGIELVGHKDYETFYEEHHRRKEAVAGEMRKAKGA